MKKKVLTAALALAMSAGICGSVYAAEATLQIGSDKMSVDGVEQTIDTPPVIIDSRTLVPIRATVEALNGSVDWDNETKTAILTNSSGDVVKLTINSKTASLNGVETELDTPPVIINERTMLPIRFVAESFGYKTDWNANEKIITVTSGAEADTVSTENKPFDLTGIEKEHLATDVNGNEYSVYYKNENESYIGVKDKSGKETIYKEVREWANIYKDKNGGSLKYIFSDDEIYTIIFPDGTKKKAAINDDYVLSDEDGNIYDNSDINMVVKDKSGKTVATYAPSQEIWQSYVDAEGNKVYMVQQYNDGYKDGFVSSDGEFTEFEENYEESYLGSDNRIYSFKYNYIIVTDDSYKKIEEWKKIPDTTDLIYVSNDGTEYIVTGDLADVYTLKTGSKTIKLTCDPEEEHNKKLFDSGSYGSDDDIYYNGDDGRLYVSKDFCFTVYNKDGKEEDKIEMSRFEDKYKSTSGKTYTYAYSYKEERPYVIIDGKEIDLELTMG